MRRSTNRRSRTSWPDGKSWNGDNRRYACRWGEHPVGNLIVGPEKSVLGLVLPAPAGMNRGHPASGTASFRACDSRDFRNSTVTCIKIPPTIAVLRFAAMILQYKYLRSELGATKKYGSK
jgi:hypothetical protein